MSSHAHEGVGIPKKTMSDRMTKPLIDENAVRNMVGDDDDVVREILECFLETSPALVDNMKAGTSARDAVSVHRAAHSLKSAARAVGALDLAESCVVLENAGDDEDWKTIDSLLPTAARQMAELQVYVAAFLKAKQPA